MTCIVALMNMKESGIISVRCFPNLKFSHPFSRASIVASGYVIFTPATPRFVPGFRLKRRIDA